MSLCPIASFVESGENAMEVTTYDFLPYFESIGFVLSYKKKLLGTVQDLKFQKIILFKKFKDIWKKFQRLKSWT